MDKNLKAFLDRHDIKVLNSSRRHVSKPMDIPVTDTKFGIVLPDELVTKFYHLVEIEESQLANIADVEALFYNINRNDEADYKLNLFEVYLDAWRAERRARNRSAAAQEAYDQYRTILALTASEDELALMREIS